MAIEFLHQLHNGGLPATVSALAEIEVVRILALAGHVKADIPPPERTLAGFVQRPAVVHGITRLGRQMLARFPPGEGR